ncbi:MAG: hypothetical protein WA687_04010 [Solirubrobacterales bacterium]
MLLKRIAVTALLVLAAPIALAACGGDEGGSNTTTAVEEKTAPKAPPKPAIETIVIRNGEPVGGVQELEYDAGEQIRFRVRSDRADEVHVHGYDIEQEIPAGGTATLSFPADIEGIFEVELHESEAQIAELRVNP